MPYRMRHITALTEGVSRRAAIQRQLLPVLLGWFTEGSELTPCVNVAIEALTADGTLDALAVEWLQGEGTIPEISAS